MSLLGRLEDLSLPDIIQIVFLSRRTGVLEIIDEKGRHTVLFRHGLVVNAASPEHPDLIAWLRLRNGLSPELVDMLRTIEESGIAPGTAAVEMNVLTAEDLGESIRTRIVDVITPLLHSRDGEFNFILSESMTAADIEYDPDVVFREGGIAPPRLLGVEGEKIKPLKGLEDSMRAGKALLRGGAAEAAPLPTLGFPEPVDAAPEPQVEPAAEHAAAEELPKEHLSIEEEAAPSSAAAADNVLPFAAPEEEETRFAPVPDEAPIAERPATAPPPPTPPPPPPPAEPTGARFKVAGGLFDIATPEAQFRNVVLFERNPLIRVAAKRAFTKNGVTIMQFGSLDDVRNAMTELFHSNSFFVTFLELTTDDATLRLLLQVKRKNPRLPVVVIDGEPNLRRRHDLIRAGADLYLTKPSPARLQPGLAEEELALFADELVLFADRAFEQWQQMSGGLGPEAGRRFYEIAGRESVDRSFVALKQLINELSNPNDIDQVSSTILRLSAEYLDRGALFLAGAEAFVGLGGFGVTGDSWEMNGRIRQFTIVRSTPSVLADVAESGVAHRGKIRRTSANAALVERMGGVLPTEVVALPIVQGGRTLAILYGDNAEHRAPVENVTGLEIFLAQASYAFGNAVFAAERAGRTKV